MEKILTTRQVDSIIKNHYKDHYDAKFCKVTTKVAQIKDKLQEIDLFHGDNIFYNILHTTKVSGYIDDGKGKKYKFEEDLYAENIKAIIEEYFNDRYIISDMRFEYLHRDNPWSSRGMDIYFEGARFDVVRKDLKLLDK